MRYRFRTCESNMGAFPLPQKIGGTSFFGGFPMFDAKIGCISTARFFLIWASRASTLKHHFGPFLRGWV